MNFIYQVLNYEKIIAKGYVPITKIESNFQFRVGDEIIHEMKVYKISRIVYESDKQIYLKCREIRTD